MSDFDFDKSFSADFRKSRPAEAKPAQWERVSASLRQNEEKKRRKRLALLWLPYLLTAATLGLLLWNRKANERQLSGLQAQLGQLETALQACGEKAVAPQNTISNSATTINPSNNKHDRIDNNIVLPKLERKKSSHSSYDFWRPSLPKSSPAKTSSPIVPIENTTRTADLIIEGRNNIDSMPVAMQPSIAKQALPILESEKKPIILETDTAATGLSGTGLDITLPLADAPPTRPEKEKRPPRFGIGLGLSFTNFIIKTPWNRSPYYASVSYLFNNRWRLEAGYEMVRWRFAVTGTSNLTPPPPNADYSLLKTDILTSSSIYSLGVHRTFRLSKRLQPSLLLEWVAYQSYKTRYDFIYTSQNTALPNIVISKEQGSVDWRIDNLRFGGGLSYKILPWLEGRTQVGYRITSIIKEENNSYWVFYCKIGIMGYF